MGWPASAVTSSKGGGPTSAANHSRCAGPSPGPVPSRPRKIAASAPTESATRRRTSVKRTSTSSTVALASTRVTSAISASTAARARSTRSARLRSVTSVAMTSAEITSPSRSRTGPAARCSSSRRPSRAMTSRSRPVHALAREHPPLPLDQLLHAGPRTNGTAWPTASSADHPRSSSHAGFQNTIVPLRSIAKIAIGELSTSDRSHDSRSAS